MTRTISLNVAAGLLALGSASAHADHDRVRYVLGGALVGAAVGELVYASRRDAGQVRHYPRVSSSSTVVYHHAPPPRTRVVYYSAPPPRTHVVYYSAPPAPATVFVPPGLRRPAGFVPPGHLKKANRGRPGRAHRAPSRVVQVYYP